MRILYISPSLPNSMSRIRTQNIIKAMIHLGHEVTLVSFVYDNVDMKALAQWKSEIGDVRGVKLPRWKSIMNCLLGLWLPVPLRVSFCKSKKMRETIEACICDKEFDLVYIKRLRMAQYAKIMKKKGIYTIIDITDSLTKYYDRIRKIEHGIKKIIAIEEYYKHKLYEPWICRKNDPIVICSEEDKNYLAQFLPEDNNAIHVFNNSIETNIWKNTTITISPAGERTRLVFFGMMDYAPNINATEYLITQVMPILPEKYILEIVGANCGEHLLQYESERVHFSGYVEDMRTELEKNDIFICPILAGAGVKNKILQASMVGIPIVSTTLGVEGIHKDILKYVFIADDAEAISNKIIQIDGASIQELKNRIIGQQEVVIRDYDNILTLKECFKELGIDNEKNNIGLSFNRKR